MGSAGMRLKSNGDDAFVCAPSPSLLQNYSVVLKIACQNTGICHMNPTENWFVE